jgi:hypothetical protein
MARCIQKSQLEGCVELEPWGQELFILAPLFPHPTYVLRRVARGLCSALHILSCGLRGSGEIAKGLQSNGRQSWLERLLRSGHAATRGLVARRGCA